MTNATTPKADFHVARDEVGIAKGPLTVSTEAAATATPTALDICCETLAKLVARLIRGGSMSA